MTVQILAMPDSHNDRVTWLEQQLCGVQLADLIDELYVVQDVADDGSAEQTLDALLPPDQLAQVVRSGLATLSETQLLSLLRNPSSLLELQEKLLYSNGDRWQVAGDDEFQSSIERVAERLTGEISATQAVKSPTSSARRMVMAVSTIAAVLLFGVLLKFQFPGKPDRMLNRPVVDSQNVEATEYFQRIADDGRAWFEKDVQSSEQLQMMLVQVSDDCQHLIDSVPNELTDAQRSWFVEKCTNWKNKLDNTLAELNDGTITFEEARERSNGIMQKLVDVLEAGPVVSFRPRSDFGAPNSRVAAVARNRCAAGTRVSNQRSLLPLISRISIHRTRSSCGATADASLGHLSEVCIAQS